MKVSIITPTYERGNFLTKLYGMLQKQTYTNWEWLIYDTSARPLCFSDPQISYYHHFEPLSIGEKRNQLIQRAQGEIIVQCDDDDFYASTYLAFMVEKLLNTDFFTFTSWFSYDCKTEQIYFWATDEVLPTQYIVSPLTGAKIRESDVREYLENRNTKMNIKGRKGYGFSFGYRREVARACTFPDCDFGEDWRFFEAVENQGFSMTLEPDHRGRVIHFIHDTNTSTEYPQYRIPHFLVRNLFPEFFTHISSYAD